MAGITHLRSIAISAEDPSSLLPFYEQTWGLERVAETDAGTIMLRARGAEHHVLQPGPGTGPRTGADCSGRRVTGRGGRDR